ncbi:MAG: NADH-quinone oxidoreductase subunit N, partial [Syntrophorhabdales bacterium]
MVLVMIALTITRSRRVTFLLSLSGILAALAGLAAVRPLVPAEAGPLFIVDGFALFYAALVLAAGFVVAVLSYDYLGGRETSAEEFYLLLLGALVGALALVSSRHFVSFFLGLEILSISLYPLIAYPGARPSHTEAGIKYLIVSGVSSAFLLFGMAILYGLGGTMEFTTLAARMNGLAEGRLMAAVGMVFLITGVGFKLGVVPFHMWTPDVYEGAPAPVTAFIATVSKGAVFALLLRYFTDVRLDSHPPLFVIFTVVAIASMVAGNLLALFQTNIKRLLAYSSIAHFGYLLVAFMSAGPLAVTAVTYYLVAYFVTTLGAFGVVTLLSSKEADADRIEDYEGLFQRRPWLAGTFTLMLLSLAGMPLTAGFIGKFFVVAAGIASFLWLPVVILIVTSAVGLFYYLRVISALFRSPREGTSPAAPSPLKAKIVLAVLVVLLVWWGVYPGPLVTIIELRARQKINGPSGSSFCPPASLRKGHVHPVHLAFPRLADRP